MAPKKTGFIVGAVAGAGVAAAALAGVGLRLPEASADNAKPRLIQVSGPAVFAPPPGAPLSFADIFDKVSPAVVSINVTSKVERQRGIPGFENFPFDLQPRGKGGPGGQGDGHGGQDDGGGDQGGGKDDDSNTAMASGSGFFISPDGYVVTNNHVVDNGSEVQITMDDGKTLDAKVIGTDEKTDLALLKVEGKDFPYVRLAGQKARIGDWVVAIGNPFGLGGTVTAGIVSAQHRDIGAGPYDDFIQIDASVNKGNSGGPTFNLAGEVVGVNTAIFSPSGGNVGIAFAIPSSTVESVVASLKDKGSVTRGFIGVQMQPVTKEIAEAIGLKEPKGALVAEAIKDSPAAKAGIRTGDTIIAVDGQTINEAKDLSRKVATVAPGKSLSLTLWREGKERTVTLEVGSQPKGA